MESKGFEEKCAAVTDEQKEKISQAEIRDEMLNEVSGGVQAGPFVTDSYVDEFGNRYVRDENGNFVMAKNLQMPTKKGKTYI